MTIFILLKIPQQSIFENNKIIIIFFSILKRVIYELEWGTLLTTKYAF